MKRKRFRYIRFKAKPMNEFGIESMIVDTQNRHVIYRTYFKGYGPSGVSTRCNSEYMARSWTESMVYNSKDPLIELYIDGATIAKFKTHLLVDLL